LLARYRHLLPICSPLIPLFSLSSPSSSPSSSLNSGAGGAGVTEKKKMGEYAVPLVIFFNIVCSLGVIFANKYLFSELEFHYTGLLTALHFVATSILSWGLIGLKYEEANHLDWGKIFLMASVTCISIWFQNLSLFLNSVGFYQIAKLSVIPCTLLLQFLLYRIQVSGQTQLSLLVLTVGLGIATITQVDLRMVGFFAGLVGVTTTSLQQIVYSALMKDKKMTGTQLYYNIGPLSAALMMVGGFFLDAAMNDQVNIIHTTWTSSQMHWVMISCTLAAPMNFSSAMLLANTSPVTFQVLGHVKTGLVFLIGFVFFNSPITPANIAGISLAMLGVMWYSKIQLETKK